MLKVKPDNIAFTANALVHGIKAWSYHLFDYTKDYGKIYICENALMKHPDIANVSFSSPTPIIIQKNWFKFYEVPYVDENELQRLFLFANNNPRDDLTIVVDTLNEFAYLNRALGQDQLITIYDLRGD